MKRKVYVMRHGQTLFNSTKKVQGWCDSPLTDLGINQAKTARDYFLSHNISFDKAYSSSLTRACETTEIILDGKLDYTRSKGLWERGFGKLEGSDEIPLKAAGEFPFGDELLDVGAEPEAVCRKRVSDTIKSFMDDEGDSILVVTHGCSCAEFAIEWDEYADYHFTEIAGNCGIYIYDYENGIFSLQEVVEHAKFEKY